MANQALLDAGVLHAAEFLNYAEAAAESLRGEFKKRTREILDIARRFEGLERRRRIRQLLDSERSLLEQQILNVILDAYDAQVTIEEDNLRNATPHLRTIPPPDSLALRRAIDADMREYIRQFNDRAVRRVIRVYDQVTLIGPMREKTGNYMRTLIRTGVTESTTRAKQAVWDANRDIVKGVRWVSVLDDRTSATCRHRDARVGPANATTTWVQPKGTKALVPRDARPPAHFNCRSTIVPYVAGEQADQEQYYEWLDRQRIEVQLRVLGPARWALWKKEGVRPEQFTTRRGDPLTLEEIKKKVAR